MKLYCYTRCCVDCDDCVDDLNQMIELATQVSYETMLHYCHGLIEWAEAHGYARTRWHGLTLRQDNHITYHKSRFRGRTCFFLQWSGIEYIWELGQSQSMDWGYGDKKHRGHETCIVLGVGTAVRRPPVR